MTFDDLVTIATYGSPHEASVVDGALEAAGISAYLSGEEVASTLWYVGTALGGVKLQVRSSDVDRAMVVLNSLQQDANEPGSGPWKCPTCHAEVDAGFEVCWSCGTPADESILQSKTFTDDATDAQPRHSLPPSDPSQDDTDGSRTPEETVARAWRSAVFGMVFPPLLIYAGFLILEVAHQPLNPHATRKFYGSLAIVTVMLAVYAVFYGTFG